MTNPLKQLGEADQAPWLDYLHRKIVADASLKRRVEEDGLKGLTSNPSIFEKAIGETDDYDDELRTLIDKADGEMIDLFEKLAVSDIQGAADILRPVYDAEGTRDGYVSLEVSPYLALDAEGTLNEARRLWRWVDRPNLMIKVPGTKECVPTIRQLISEGINVNVTLLFSIESYLAVAEAYIAGLEALKAGGGDVSKVHSVASFFVSRIDSQIDGKIDKRLADEPQGADTAALKGVRGKVAIANAKAAYQHYLEMIGTDRWKALAAAGASPQRLLWASTGTKDKAYSDVLYVDSLIGPDTVNTMPPETMDAFRDHGRVTPSLTDDVEGARVVLAEAERLGLDLAGVTDFLVKDGVKKFAQAFDKLLGAVANKRATILGNRLNSTSNSAGDLEDAWKRTIDKAAEEGWTRKLWRRDASMWTGSDEAKWLGWLDASLGKTVDIPRLEGLRAHVKAKGYKHALLLGMGGSSLGPEVLAKTFGARPGFPELLVLDSTDPVQVARFEGQIDPANTLFIVSSKSGSTLEPDVLHRYFYDLVEERLGKGKAGERFIAVTDPGSQLEETAKRDGFAGVFHGEPSIGGRYSVLSHFGMVPAAVIGLDVRRIFEGLEPMVRACGASAPPGSNPGFALGILLGVAAVNGRDKVTLITSDPISDLGAWLEQLIAESTGKQGKGLVPIDLEPLGQPGVYGKDRVFAYVRLHGVEDPAKDGAVQALEQAGEPVSRIVLATPECLFQELFRWEVAIAAAGAVIGINPFDQPDVEASKIKTRELTKAYDDTGKLPAEPPVLEDGGLRFFTDPANAEALRAAAGAETAEAWLRAHFARAKAGDYIGLLAYLDRAPANIQRLQGVRKRLRDSRKVATVLEFGPRFLHSTGQAYKGGPNSGIFLQITATADGEDLAIPGRKATFGVIEAAEALGDFEVLAERKRRVLRVDIGSNVDEGLARLVDAALRSM